jgi:eukaryotic-like serine/threonine-protein kinase
MITYLPTSPQYEFLQRDISEARAPLVFVIGSGLSRSAGLPDWKALRLRLSGCLRQQEQHYNQQHQSYEKNKYANAYSEKDPWVFFQKATRLLTPPIFNRIIEQELTPQSEHLPSGYSNLMALRPRGVVSLNLDRLCGDAIATVRPNHTSLLILGTELERKWQILNEETPFVVYLHGHVSDSKSWILTYPSLR